ncbi:unnamed protein product [Symbiodinium microadriaticum]|nr:unnamed protein product [Symbiodinium microadriaticum]
MEPRLRAGVSTCHGDAGQRFRSVWAMSMATVLPLMRTALSAGVGASGCQDLLGALPLVARAASPVGRTMRPADWGAKAGARGSLEESGGIRQDVLDVSTRLRAYLLRGSFRLTISLLLESLTFP